MLLSIVMIRGLGESPVNLHLGTFSILNLFAIVPTIFSELENEFDVLSLIQLKHPKKQQTVSQIEVKKANSACSPDGTPVCTPVSVIVKTGCVQPKEPKDAVELMNSPIKRDRGAEGNPVPKAMTENIWRKAETDFVEDFFQELVSNLDQFCSSLEQVAPHAGDECVPLEFPHTQHPNMDFPNTNLADFDTKEKEIEDRMKSKEYDISNPRKNIMWGNFDTPGKRKCYQRSDSGPAAVEAAWRDEQPAGREVFTVDLLVTENDSTKTDAFQDWDSNLFVKNVPEVFEEPPDQILSCLIDSQKEMSKIMFDCNM